MAEFLKGNDNLDAMTTSGLKFLGKSLCLAPGTFRFKLSNLSMSSNRLVMNQAGEYVIDAAGWDYILSVWSSINWKYIDIEFEMPLDCVASDFMVSNRSGNLYYSGRGTGIKKARIVNEFGYTTDTRYWGFQIDIEPYCQKDYEATYGLKRNLRILSINVTGY